MVNSSGVHQDSPKTSATVALTFRRKKTLLKIDKQTGKRSPNRTMASLYMAQEVLICDRCNVAPVQKYCNKCDASLCDGCVIKHISSDKTKSHDIVIYELKNEDPKFPDCKIHAKNQCEMHCKECDNPVCVKCITSGSHQNHHFIDMLEIFKCDKDAIFQDTQVLETSLYPTIEHAISELQTKLAELPKNHEKLLTSISQLGAEWHGEIDVIIEKRKEEAIQMKTRDLATLEKLLADLKNLLSAINRAILDNKQLLKSNKFSEMKSYKSRVSEFQKSPTKFDVTPPTFTSGPIPKEQLNKMFGILKSSSISSQNEITSSTLSPSKDSPKVRSDFHTGYKKLYDIACHSSDDIWVRGNERNIKRFNHKGSLQETITTKTGYPGGITVTLQGELIYTDQGDDNIYIVRNGKPQKMITVQGWRPMQPYYTASGDLLVGMYKDDQTPKKVVRYRGSTENQVLQFDQNGKPWFSTGSNTLFIDENRNGDLCASDWKAKQVVVINQAGKLRFRYTGNLSDMKYTNFAPCGIAIDGDSQILVADHDNNCIHIIREDGHFIRYIDNCELSWPLGVSLDKNNTLYVTERETAKLKTIEYIK